MNESPSPAPGPSSPVPVFRVSFANATILSAGYLLVGALVELVRRAWNPRWAEQLSWSMEAFPAGILRTVGLLDALREAYASGGLHETHVRLIYAGSVVVTIYAIGLGVGAVMWLLLRSRARLTP
ncbi:MAG: hypothetical protein IAE78_32520 [Myxococcus sp.]|nr:hypothetical protein [Myxococcus sp.]